MNDSEHVVLVSGPSYEVVEVHQVSYQDDVDTLKCKDCFSDRQAENSYMHR